MTKRIFVAGHKGMVGSAIARQLSDVPNTELVTRTRAELDLSIQQDVADFFASEKIDEVYLGAAKVGGIHANDTYPAEFIYDNLMVECNVVHQAWKSGVQKLLFLGSSCIYPRMATQPIKEAELMQGSLAKKSATSACTLRSSSARVRVMSSISGTVLSWRAMAAPTIPWWPATKIRFFIG